MSTWTDKNGLRQRVSVTNTTAEQRDQARRFVASQAHSLQDCIILLSMLGLAPENGKWT